MPNSTRIIDIAELGAGERIPRYAAVWTTQPADPFVLSPGVMRWSDETYLSELERSAGFWLAQKKKRRVRLGELFDSVLRERHGGDYIAVLGDHPWPCLLFLHDRVVHQARGLYLLPARLNRNIYRALDWDAWFAPQADLARQLEACRARGFDADRFRTRQAQFRRFVERLSIDAPRAMFAADGNAIARRFGRWQGRIWRWSYADAAGLDGFPWQAYAPEPPPAVRRDLDYPVNDWDTTAALLREDCARLSALTAAADGMHVNLMRWQITLYNQARVEVELSFRHPYSLERDAPQFATALYQARYVYDDVMRKLAARETDLDLPDTIPFVAWRLELSERLSLTPQCLDLFAGDDANVDCTRVMHLQNKLPVELECYRGMASYFAEDSFDHAPIGAPRGDGDELEPWTGSACNKPLFYYPAAQVFEPSPRFRPVFVERAARPWWRDGDADNSMRDYFILRDPHGRASWVYRDADGAWYRQGEFY